MYVCLSKFSNQKMKNMKQFGSFFEQKQTDLCQNFFQMIEIGRLDDNAKTTNSIGGACLSNFSISFLLFFDLSN
jgi:hypothetical protein